MLSFYFPEINLYFNLYSQEFTKGFAVKSEYFHPSPFGSESLPIVGEIAIESKEGDVLVIKNKEKVNHEEVNRILKEMRFFLYF